LFLTVFSVTVFPAVPVVPWLPANLCRPISADQFLPADFCRPVPADRWLPSVVPRPAPGSPAKAANAP